MHVFLILGGGTRTECQTKINRKVKLTTEERFPKFQLTMRLYNIEWVCDKPGGLEIEGSKLSKRIVGEKN